MAEDKQKDDKDKTPAELIAERDDALAAAEAANKAAEKAIAKSAKAKRGEVVDIFADDYDGPMDCSIAEARNKRKAEQAAKKNK